MAGVMSFLTFLTGRAAGRHPVSAAPAAALVLRLPLRASARLAAWLVAAHGLAALGLWRTHLDFAGTQALKPLVLATIAFSLVATLRRHALRRGRGAVRELRLYADGGADITTGAGGVVPVGVRPDGFLTPPLTVLRLWPLRGGRGYRLVIVPGVAASDAYRRLRVRLRHGETLPGGVAAEHGPKDA